MRKNTVPSVNVRTAKMTKGRLSVYLDFYLHLLLMVFLLYLSHFRFLAYKLLSNLEMHCLHLRVIFAFPYYHHNYYRIFVRCCQAFFFHVTLFYLSLKLNHTYTVCIDILFLFIIYFIMFTKRLEI